MLKIITTALLSLVLVVPVMAQTDPTGIPPAPMPTPPSGSLSPEEMRKLMLEKEMMRLKALEQERAAREGFQNFRTEGQEVLRKEADQIRQKAQEQIKATRDAAKAGMPAQGEDFDSIRRDVVDQARLIRANALEEIQVKRVLTREAFEEKRKEMREAIIEGREEFQKAIEAKREAVKMETEIRRGDLKKKLAAVKDERKKEAVEKVDEKIADLNARQMAHFSDKLEQMEGVLERIVSRADKAQANGKDTSSVTAAVSDANTAIDAARALITAQTGKMYPIDVTSEENLKANVKAARDAFKADLDKVKDGVKAAHDAVRKAATTLAQIPGVNNVQAPATSTASSTAN